MNNTQDELYNYYFNIVKEKISAKSPLTHESIITNTIVTSKKLINEIEILENVLLDNPSINNNSLLILSANLELMIQKVKKLKLDNLKK